MLVSNSIILQFARARIQFRIRAITSLSARGTTCRSMQQQTAECQVWRLLLPASLPKLTSLKELHSGAGITLNITTGYEWTLWGGGVGGGAPSQGVKWPVHDSNHPPPSTAEIKNSGAIPPLPPYVLIKHSDNSTFYITIINLIYLCMVTASVV
jgi:hypothetical protein